VRRRAEPDVSLTWRTGDDPPPEEWPALYASGLTIAEIALRTGHHYVRVRAELLARGVTMRPSCPRLAAWHEAAAALRARGFSYAAIGREVGRSAPAVQMALLRRARRAEQP
jgi:hypothetical protein